MKYYEGDIVEILHFDVYKGSEGRVINDWGFIPKVGDRFIVYYQFDSEHSNDVMVSVRTGKDKIAHLYYTQVTLYKRKHEMS